MKPGQLLKITCQVPIWPNTKGIWKSEVNVLGLCDRNELIIYLGEKSLISKNFLSVLTKFGEGLVWEKFVKTQK